MNLVGPFNNEFTKINGQNNADMSKLYEIGRGILVDALKITTDSLKIALRPPLFYISSLLTVSCLFLINTFYFIRAD